MDVRPKLLSREARHAIRYARPRQLNESGSEKIRHLDIVEGFRPRACDDGINAADASQVMRGLAVLIKRLCGLEYLVNDKAVVILGAAQHVEAKVSRLATGAFIIDPESIEKLVDMALFDVNCDRVEAPSARETFAIPSAEETVPAQHLRT